MTIFVDTAHWEWQGHRWAHLVSDESIEELHVFARAVGLRYLSFGLDHYDIPGSAVPTAVELGAQPVGSRELARRLVASGLRRREGHAARRWHTKVTGSAPLTTDRADVVAAAMPVPHPAAGHMVAAAADAAFALLGDGEWRILQRRREGVLVLEWSPGTVSTAGLETAAAASAAAAADAVDLVVVAHDERAATVELVVTSQR